MWKGWSDNFSFVWFDGDMVSLLRISIFHSLISWLESTHICISSLITYVNLKWKQYLTKKIASFYLGTRFLSLQRMLQLLGLFSHCSFLPFGRHSGSLVHAPYHYDVFCFLASCFGNLFLFSLKYSLFSQTSLLFCPLLHPTSFSLPWFFNTCLLSFTISVLESYQCFFQIVVMVSFLYSSSFKFSLKSDHYEEQNQYSNSTRVRIEKSL